MIPSYPGLKTKHLLKNTSVLFLLIFAFLFQGCGTLSSGRGWGQDATLIPGWERIRNSAVNAVTSPETWGPLAGAVVLQINDMDKSISDWASDNNPIFGSMENAGKWSDRLKESSRAVYVISAFVAPGGDDTSEWLTAKTKGLAVGLTAAGATSVSTKAIKKISGRTRPDESDNKSFPSSHSSDAAAFNTLARRNLGSISMSPAVRVLTRTAVVGTAVGTGWARVEAKKHYPSDVLAGYALGHFFSAFINDAFLGLSDDGTPVLTIASSRKGIWLGAYWSF